MRTTRILLASLALILLCLVLANEARRYPIDEESLERAPPLHKHRHRHELQSRWPAPSKKRAGSDEDDYYDDSDYEDYLDEDEESLEDEYKDRRAGRSHSPKSRTGSNHRRYPPRYHHRASSHHVGSARGHEGRAHERLSSNHHRLGSRPSAGGYRKRWKDEDVESEEEIEYERTGRRRHEDEDAEEEADGEPSGYYHGKQHKSPRRSRSRYEPRKDWRYRLDDEDDDYAYDADDEESEEQLENERANRSRKHSARRSFRAHAREDESPKAASRRSSYSKLDEWMRRVRNSSRRNPEPELELDDEDLELWKDEEEELDNDFYKNDESSLKSYDDIIRRLTEDRTTEAPTKREYRNTFYESRRGRSGASRANLVDASGRKKSLQDEEEDEEDEEAQADANMDYNEDDSMASGSSPSTTRSPPPTTSSSTTSTTTTTTVRPWWTSASRNTRNFRSDTKNDPPMSAISAAKWDNLGTREGVEKTRNNMLSENSKASEFNAVQSHAIRVAREGSCRWPRAKVIPVLDIYYNSTATYYPHCVILHRCSDDTGCCRSESLTCEAKQSQRVELAFHVTYIHGNQGIARLSFDNHTECRCSERKSFDGHRNPRHNMQAPANIVKQQRPRKPCRCPSNFLPTITSDDTCECTCPDKEETCHKLLIGKGYLSNVDRVCIQSEMCTAPKCVYGAYIVENGSCPLKRRFVEANAWPRRTSNNYQYHPRGRSWRTP